jgi:hypothetical protein
MTTYGCSSGSETMTMLSTTTSIQTSKVTMDSHSTTSRQSFKGTVDSHSATLISDISAALNGSLSYSGNIGPVDVYFNYGTEEDNLANSTPTQTVSSQSVFSQPVTGLVPNTTYYFQPVTDGLTITKGRVLSFTTAIISSDYYYAFINTNGTLKFTNKNSGDLILDNAPTYHCDYGIISSRTDVTPINAGFETDANSDGIPDGWTVDKTSIRQTEEQASQGTKSLKFDLTADDTDHRRAYSPLITVNPDTKYIISVDSYLSSFTAGYPRLLIAYYTNADGKGTPHADNFIGFPTGTGQWLTTSQNLILPYGAKAFRVLIYCPQNDVEVLYVDNIKVTEVNLAYQTNGNVASSVTTNGGDVIVSSTDSSNPDVIIDNKYELNIHSPNVKYTTNITYKNNVTVSEERYDFIVPTRSASVMTRDLKLVPYDVSNEYYSDSFTPKVVKFNNGLSFLGNDTMQSMDLKGYDEASSTVWFYADYYLNHPHDNVVKNGNEAVVDASAQKRTAGDSNNTFVVFRIDPGKTPKTLVKTRQPDGYDAVITFTNHPDQETTAAVNAVAYGTEDTNDPSYGTRGMIPRGIGWTKGVFVSGQPGADLDDAAYKALTDKLYHDGVEIVPHTITRLTDSREEVTLGLQVLSQYGSHDWIDHGRNGGIMNWEDLSSQGALKGDENYILDILDEFNYNLAWSYNDLAVSNLGTNMLQPLDTNRNTPYFFYNVNLDDNTNDDKIMYIWTTISTVQRTDLVYTHTYIDSLISERGVSIGHDYIAYPLDQDHTWWINPATNKKEIYPQFDDELAYIQSKREAGLLWTPTMAGFGDYLIRLAEVSIVTNADGTYTVTNNGSQSITGVTLLSESAIESVTIDGKVLNAFGGVFGDNELVLPTISPGQSCILNLK